MANVPLSIGVPKLYVPSLYVPHLKDKHINVPHLLAPGDAGVRIPKRTRLHAKDLGDLILGNPITGTKQLQNTLEDSGYGYLASVPLINRLVGAGVMADEQFIQPMSEGQIGVVGINTLETLGSSLDLIANPVKSLLPVAGGGTYEDFMKSMGWVDEEYRKIYQWDSGNFIVDFVGEVLSDPTNWFSLGGKQLLKEGTDLVSDSTRSMIKLVTKSDDVSPEIFRRVSNMLYDDESLKNIMKDLRTRRDELKDMLSTMRANSDDFLVTQRLIKDYNKLLAPTNRKVINQAVADLRYSDGYRKFQSIRKVVNTATDVDNAIREAAFMLAPAANITRLVIKHIASPTFKVLWNSFTRSLNDVDLKVTMNDMEGSIRKTASKIITRSRSLHTDLFEPFEEVLAKYHYDIEKLVKIYIDVIDNMPADQMSLQHLDEVFLKRVSKAIPVLRNLGVNSKRYKEVLGWLKNITSGEEMTKALKASYGIDDLDKVIEAIRETAVAAHASAQVYKNAQHALNSEYADLLKNLGSIGVRKRISILLDAMKQVLGPNTSVSLHNFKALMTYVKKLNPEVYSRLSLIADYLGINFDNYHQVATLYYKRDKESFKALMELLTSSKRGLLVDYEEASNKLNKLNDVLTADAPTRLPNNYDDEESQKILSIFKDTSVKKLVEVPKTTNITESKKALTKFQKEIHPTVSRLEVSMPEELKLYYNESTGVTSKHLKKAITTESKMKPLKTLCTYNFNLKKQKDIKKLRDCIFEAKKYLYSLRNQIRTSERVHLEGTLFERDVNILIDTLNKLGDSKYIVDTIALADAVTTSYIPIISAQYRYKLLLDTFQMHEDFYKEMSNLKGPLREGLNKAISLLGETDAHESLKAIEDIKRIIRTVDAFNNVSSLFNTPYTSYDVPKRVLNRIDGEIFNTIYNNRRTFSFRMVDKINFYVNDIIHNITRYDEEVLLEHFKDYPAQLIDDTIYNYADELSTLERKLQQEGLDDIEYERFVELKEVLVQGRNMRKQTAPELYKGFLKELRVNLKESLTQYCKRLIALSSMHDFEFPIYLEFNADVVSAMTSLGENYGAIMKLLNEVDADLHIQDDLHEFISKVSGTTLVGDREMFARYIDGLDINNLEKVNDEVFDNLLHNYRDESLGRAITETFNRIRELNDDLAARGAILGKDINGDFVYDYLNYVNAYRYNDTLRELTGFVNAYDASVANGVLNVKKYIDPNIAAKLRIKPYEFVSISKAEYTLLYNNLEQAYHRVSKYAAYNKEAVERARKRLSILARTYDISWIPVSTHYFEELSPELIMSWDLMLRSKCFSTSVARNYAKIIIDEPAYELIDYNEKIDYYSNPWRIFQGLDEIDGEPISADNAYDDLIEHIDPRFFDELYAGVTSDLNKVIKDPDSLLDVEFLFKTQIQEQTKALDRLRKLNDFKGYVGDYDLDKTTLNILKRFYIYEDTPINSPQVYKLLMLERQKALADTVKSLNAKQLRTYIDINTEGILYYVSDKYTPALKYSDKDLQEAGLVMTTLSDAPNIQIIRRTSNKPATHAAFKYVGLNSHFPREQQVITDIFKQNRHHFYWDGMNIPDELFTGNMVSKNTYDTIKKHPSVAAFLGDVAGQKAYSKMDKNGLSTFFTTEVSRPDAVFVGAPNAQHVVLDAVKGTFEKLKQAPVYNSTDLVKSTWRGSISAIKRENKINKYLQLWFNKDYSLDNPTFRRVLEGASNGELKKIFSREHYAAVIVKEGLNGRPKVYRIFIENQKQLKAAIAANAIMVPHEVYRNMVLAVNKGKLDNDFVRIYKRLIVGTFKTIYLATPGYLMRNALDSLIQKNASSTDGAAGIIDNFKYEWKARKLLDWHNEIQKVILTTYEEDEVTGDVIEKAIKTLNRRSVRYALEGTPRELHALYNLIDMFLESSASGGLSKALEEYLLDYNLNSGKFTGYVWEQWYGEKILGSKIFKIISDTNSTIEQSARLGLFLRLIDSGSTITEAVSKVVGPHFDYSLKEGPMEALEDFFWFSTFPINNVMYYINEGMEKNPELFKIQMDLAEQSWNDGDMTWDDVKKSNYLTRNALMGNLRFKVGDKDILLKTGSSVFDFLGIMIDPAGNATDRVNPFLSVLFGIESTDQLNPFGAVASRANQITTAIRQVLNGEEVTASFAPSIYNVLYSRDYKPKHYIEYEPRAKSSWGIKPRKVYARKPDNMKRMRYRFNTNRYYFGRGKNLHRWLSATTSIEPYWYMSKRRYLRTGRNYKVLAKQIKHIR